MKTSFRNLGLAVGVLAITSLAYGQKKNETSAAVEYKNNFQPAFMKQDMESAKKSLTKAKEFIDLAASHEDTKGSQKTLLYKGQIYGSWAMIMAMDENPDEAQMMEALNTSVEAFKTGHKAGKKYKSDIEQAVNTNITLFNMAASASYKAEEYKDAAEAYDFAAKYSDAIGQLDTNMVYNSALCYEKAEDYGKAAKRYERLAKVNYRGSTSAILASSAYRKSGDIEKAKSIINEARKADPSNKELLLELVNTNIDAGDAAGAEAALNDAISTDPNNKQLHYTIGTIYIDLKDNEKAEKALNKALEIDPNYVDAQYQLGAHLVTWAGNLNTEAKQLPFGDANYNKMLAESEEIYKRALVPLEKYISSYPDDKQVLTILFQIHRNLGNSEKALEYKKKADAAK